MLNRILIRLRYASKSVILFGFILLFTSDYNWHGFGFLVVGVSGYLFLSVKTKKGNSKLKNEVDGEGDAKPNYR